MVAVRERQRERGERDTERGRERERESYVAGSAGWEPQHSAEGHSQPMATLQRGSQRKERPVPPPFFPPSSPCGGSH